MDQTVSALNMRNNLGVLPFLLLTTLGLFGCSGERQGNEPCKPWQVWECEFCMPERTVISEDPYGHSQAQLDGITIHSQTGSMRPEGFKEIREKAEEYEEDVIGATGMVLAKYTGTYLHYRPYDTIGSEDAQEKFSVHVITYSPVTDSFLFPGTRAFNEVYAELPDPSTQEAKTILAIFEQAFEHARVDRDVKVASR